MARLGQQMSTAAADWRLRSRSRSRDRTRVPQYEETCGNLEDQGPSSMPNQVRSGRGCQMAKFDPFLTLDCTRLEGVGAQSKEKKGSNFAA